MTQPRQPGGPFRGVRHDFMYKDDPHQSCPLRQGADFVYAFQLYDEEPTDTTPGRLTDLDGLAFRSQFRAGGVSGPVEAEPEFTVVTDGAGKEWVVMRIPGWREGGNDTRSMTAPSGVYDVEVVDVAAGETREVLYGDYDLALEATQLAPPAPALGTT